MTFFPLCIFPFKALYTRVHILVYPIRPSHNFLPAPFRSLLQLILICNDFFKRQNTEPLQTEKVNKKGFFGVKFHKSRELFGPCQFCLVCLRFGLHLSMLLNFLPSSMKFATVTIKGGKYFTEVWGLRDSFKKKFNKVYSLSKFSLIHAMQTEVDWVNIWLLISDELMKVKDAC